ncbi:hypothetical protein AB4076_00285 [Dyella sp. 2RAF44]|uniref:hypothetical protein n=1 Tax=Dyella sp. 2RAF44 TaxID=3233000 RepID=UPI003F90B179
MAATALKVNLPFVDEERLGGLEKSQRLEIYERAECSRFQISQIEAMVADSGLRLVGKGALNNMRTRFVSNKNKAVRLIESHTCERTYAYRLEFDPGVVGYYVQPPCRGIERTNENGARHVSHATLDFLVFRLDCIELVECKTEAWLEAHEGKDGWHREGDGWTCDPYKQWAEARGLVFRVFVLTEPFANQLRTSEAMYATMDLPLTREELRVAERAIALLAKKPYSIEDMGETLPGFNGRIALSLLAQHKCYGLVQSTPFDLPQHFYLYSDQEQAGLADAQAFSALRTTIAQPADLDPLTTASATDLKFALKRYEIVQRIEAGLEKGSVRMRKLVAKVREAVSQGKPALSACLTQYAKSGNRESRLDPMAKKVLARRGRWYMPSMRVLTKDIGVSATRLKDFDPETYEAYLGAYLRQCRPAVRYTRGVAFAAARKEIEGQNPTTCTHSRMWWLPHHVEKVAPVNLEDAYYASYGAVVYWRLLAHAKSHAQGAVAAKEDIRWTESAQAAIAA